MTACCGGNVPALAALLKSGEVSVNMRSGKTKPTLLHMAAYCGQVNTYIVWKYCMCHISCQNDTYLSAQIPQLM